MSVLSDRGVARREAGLEALKGVVRRRGRRRVVVRSVGAMVVVLGAGVWVSMLGRGAAVKPGPVGPGPVAPVEVAHAGPASVGELRVEIVSVAGVAMVKTDPRVLAELAPAKATVARLDDAELQEALRAAGKPVGLVRVAGRVTSEWQMEQGGAGM